MAIYLADPSEIPPRAPARDPPFFKTRAVRRRRTEPQSPQLAFSL